MATKAATGKTFSLTAKMDVTVSKNVIAPTMEEALAIGRGLKLSDFIQIEPNDIIDYEPTKLTGVYENI